MVRAVRKERPDHALHEDEAFSLLWEAGVRWIAWGFHVVDGETEPYIVGKLDGPNVIVAIVNARRRYGCLKVDHVQSVASYEIDLLETHHDLICRKRHRRPYKRRRQLPLVPK